MADDDILASLNALLSGSKDSPQVQQDGGGDAPDSPDGPEEPGEYFEEKLKRCEELVNTTHGAAQVAF